jgi:hypothetical protein
MKRILATCLAGLTLASLSGIARATEVELGVVQIESLASVARAFALHKAGNFEVKIRNGFTAPSGLNCDRQYVTTSAAIDADGALLALLLSGAPRIGMRISDSPELRAYPTTATASVVPRCSIVALGIYATP